eukprot:TRINITY_DN22249_c0_g1_i1.p1 TRINITY_DN22249_c0_g1~~TRINITY_DN22249_c0_g1_i1.p1  ORF type:complete len:233 (+),score=72.24 TRINITY_DN22249_c0_g1_i1:141-839(+)
MNDSEVGKQVQQMVNFIKQEAEEKANEIAVAAKEEFEIEKLQLIEVEKRKILAEYERKEKQEDTRKKIEYSTQLNAARLKRLQAQDAVVQDIKASAEKILAGVSSNQDAYKNLLKGLIVQALGRLREPELQLTCRKVDLTAVKAVAPDAAKAYAAKAKLAKPPVIVVDEDKFLLPPPNPKDSTVPYCMGGVIVSSKDRRVICTNTLDARLEIVFKQNLPQVRARLFGASGRA